MSRLNRDQKKALRKIESALPLGIPVLTEREIAHLPIERRILIQDCWLLLLAPFALAVGSFHVLAVLAVAHLLIGMRPTSSFVVSLSFVVWFVVGVVTTVVTTGIIVGLLLGMSYASEALNLTEHVLARFSLPLTAWESVGLLATAIVINGLTMKIFELVGFIDELVERKLKDQAGSA